MVASNMDIVLLIFVSICFGNGVLSQRSDISEERDLYNRENKKLKPTNFEFPEQPTTRFSHKAAVEHRRNFNNKHSNVPSDLSTAANPHPVLNTRTETGRHPTQLAFQNKRTTSLEPRNRVKVKSKGKDNFSRNIANIDRSFSISPKADFKSKSRLVRTTHNPSAVSEQYSSILAHNAKKTAHTRSKFQGKKNGEKSGRHSITHWKIEDSPQTIQAAHKAANHPYSQSSVQPIHPYQPTTSRNQHIPNLGYNVRSHTPEIVPIVVPENTIKLNRPYKSNSKKMKANQLLHSQTPSSEKLFPPAPRNAVEYIRPHGEYNYRDYVTTGTFLIPEDLTEPVRVYEKSHKAKSYDSHSKPPLSSRLYERSPDSSSPPSHEYSSGEKTSFADTLPPDYREQIEKHAEVYIKSKKTQNATGTNHKSQSVHAPSSSHSHHHYPPSSHSTPYSYTQLPISHSSHAPRPHTYTSLTPDYHNPKPYSHSSPTYLNTPPSSSHSPSYSNRPPSHPSYSSRPPPPAAYANRPPPPAAYANRPPPPATYASRPPPPATYASRPPPTATYANRPPPPATYASRPPPPAAYANRPPPPAAYANRPPPPTSYSSKPLLPVSYSRRPSPPLSFTSLHSPKPYSYNSPQQTYLTHSTPYDPTHTPPHNSYASPPSHYSHDSPPPAHHSHYYDGPPPHNSPHSSHSSSGHPPPPYSEETPDLRELEKQAEIESSKKPKKDRIKELILVQNPKSGEWEVSKDSKIPKENVILPQSNKRTPKPQLMYHYQPYLMPITHRVPYVLYRSRRSLHETRSPPLSSRQKQLKESKSTPNSKPKKVDRYERSFHQRAKRRSHNPQNEVKRFDLNPVISGEGNRYNGGIYFANSYNENNENLNNTIHIEPVASRNPPYEFNEIFENANGILNPQRFANYQQQSHPENFENANGILNPQRFANHQQQSHSENFENANGMQNPQWFANHQQQSHPENFENANGVQNPQWFANHQQQSHSENSDYKLNSQEFVNPDELSDSESLENDDDDSNSQELGDHQVQSHSVSDSSSKFNTDNSQKTHIFDNEKTHLFDDEKPHLFDDEKPHLFNDEKSHLFNNENPDLFNNEKTLLVNNENTQDSTKEKTLDFDNNDDNDEMQDSKETFDFDENDSDLDMDDDDDNDDDGENTFKGNYQYVNNPEDDAYEYGYRMGTPGHMVERSHQTSGILSKIKMNWKDEKGNFGEHFFEFNHFDDDEPGVWDELDEDDKKKS